MRRSTTRTPTWTSTAPASTRPKARTPTAPFPTTCSLTSRASLRRPWSNPLPKPIPKRPPKKRLPKRRHPTHERQSRRTRHDVLGASRRAPSAHGTHDRRVPPRRRGGLVFPARGAGHTNEAVLRRLEGWSLPGQPQAGVHGARRRVHGLREARCDERRHLRAAHRSLSNLGLHRAWAVRAREALRDPVRDLVLRPVRRGRLLRLEVRLPQSIRLFARVHAPRARE